MVILYEYDTLITIGWMSGINMLIYGMIGCIYIWMYVSIILSVSYGGIMSKVIGIDLGTTNSCVAVIEGDSPTVITNS